MRSQLFFAPIAVCAMLALPACASSDAAASGSDHPAAADAGQDADGSDATQDQATGDTAAEADAPVDAGVTSVDEMLPAAADAICSALFRCCDAASMEEYFAAATSKPSLASFQDKVPPAVTLDATGCREVVAQMLALVPFGGWIESVSAGRVKFVASGVNECFDELAAAKCGKPVGEALDDGTCFGFAPPSSGSSQRRMFLRLGNPGAACVPVLQDGFGASFYGTCDPAKAFCCIDDPADPSGGCALPTDGLSGTCQAAGAVDETCAVAQPLDLCQAGLNCSTATGKCIVDSQEPLSAGDPCVDANYNLLGLCQDSWCDLAGTRLCESLKGDGFDCYDASECESSHCENPGPSGRCAAWSFCVAP